MAGFLYTDGVFQGIDNDGEVVALGTLKFTYSATGLDVLTYQDSSLTIANTNPINLTASGKAEVYLANGTYDVVLKDSLGVVVWSETNFTYDLETLIEDLKSIDTILALRLLTSTPDTVWVSGYHTKDDGAFGSNIFRWNPTSVEDDNGGTIIKLDGTTTGRYELKYNGEVNVKWFGAVEESTDDQLDILQQAITSAGIGGHIVIDEVYYIDATRNAVFQTYGGLIPLDYQTIECVGNGEIKVIPNSSSTYSCIQGYNLNGVTLLNLKLTGDKDSHLGTTGEFGHGIWIVNSHDINIIGGEIKDMWGDGIAPTSFTSDNSNASSMPIDFNTDISTNYKIVGCNIQNCRRQGISIIGINSFIIESCHLSNIRGTDPSAGIDCEPDTSLATNRNGVISGNIIKNCKIGIMTTPSNVGINITSNTILEVNVGTQIQGSNISISSNNISVSPVANSSLNGCFCIGSGGNKTFIGNTCTVDTETFSIGFISRHGSTPIDSVIIKGNTFKIVNNINSSIFPAIANIGEFSNNSIILESTAVVNLTSGSLILAYDNWFFDNNIFYDYRTQALNIIPINCFSGVTVIKRGKNKFIGTQYINQVVNNDLLLNENTIKYYSVSAGATSTTPVDTAIDISTIFTGLTNIRYGVFFYGRGENSQDPGWADAKITSISDTSVTVKCYNSGASFQTVFISLHVGVLANLSED